MRVKVFIGLVLLLLAGCWVARGQTIIGRPIKPLNSADCVLTFSEDFETPVTGYEESGWGSVATGSSLVDPAYTGVVLQGAQSFRYVKAAASTAYATNGWTCITNEVWIYFRMRPIDIDESATRTIFSLRTNTVDWLNLRVTTTGELQGQLAAGTITTVATISESTTYHVWIHWKSETGGSANGVADIAFSTTGTKPVSGDNFAQLTNNTTEEYMNRVFFGLEGSTAGTGEYIFDTVRISNTVIGDNPP
jgi:hypothetical protein